MREGLPALALEIYDIGAFKDYRQSPGGQGFLLKGHETDPALPLSPFFFNLRTPENPKPGPLTPEIIQRIGWQLSALASDQDLSYDLVAGVPNAGDPLAAAFCKEAFPNSAGHLLKLRKEQTPAGRRVTQIWDGSYRDWDHVILVDDLVTGADSKREAVNVLNEQNLIVRDVLVVVDRQQGGRQELAALGCDLHALFTVNELLDLYKRTGKITRQIFAECLSYHQGVARV